MEKVVDIEFIDERFLITLSKSIFPNTADARVYERGFDVHCRGLVYNVELRHYLDRYLLTGTVLSSNFKEMYHCDIPVYRSGKIEDEGFCSCPFYDNYAGMCKHRVAICLAFIEIIQGKNKYNQQPLNTTSAKLSNYLEKFRAQNHEGHKFPDNGSVSILPNLELIDA